MRVIEIDSVPYGSTCKIAVGISKVAAEQGVVVYTASGYSSHPLKELPSNHLNIGGILNKAMHLGISICTGIEGYCSVFATRKLIHFIEDNGIELIHFHNIHGNYLNYPMLFSYIKEKNVPVIWTMHDCWAVTGLCPHFTMAKCNKWKSGCHQCVQYRTTFMGYWHDQSKFMWKKKRQWFCGIENMTIVTPSQWLAGIMQESFLKDYELHVINNGIDLNVFRPTPSSFREEHHFQNKYILLGVSVSWGNRKGLDVFVELSKRLSDAYQIVLVGTNDEIDKSLPESVLSIHRTQNQKELAEIYTAADLFVNPTREENFPTVNLEALACGTPIVSFDTGGSAECFDESCGCTVPCDDVEGLARKIEQIHKEKQYSAENCIKRARQFNMYDRFAEYVDIYKQIEQRMKNTNGKN